MDRVSRRRAERRCRDRFSVEASTALAEFAGNSFSVQGFAALGFAFFKYGGQTASAFGGGFPFGGALAGEFFFEGGDDKAAAAFVGARDRPQEFKRKFHADEFRAGHTGSITERRFWVKGRKALVLGDMDL